MDRSLVLPMFRARVDDALLGDGAWSFWCRSRWLGAMTPTSVVSRAQCIYTASVVSREVGGGFGVHDDDDDVSVDFVCAGVDRVRVGLTSGGVRREAMVDAEHAVELMSDLPSPLTGLVERIHFVRVATAG